MPRTEQIQRGEPSGLQRSAPLLCAWIVSACAATHPPVQLGQYEAFQPIYHEGRMRFELARPAYVSIIAVREPWEPEAGPLIFEVLYPRYETDRLEFEAGRHNPVSRLVGNRVPINCPVAVKPTLRTCRPALHVYPQVRGGSNWRKDYPGQHYLLVASDRFIDPYELAWELFFYAFENEEVGQLLREEKPFEAARRLEQAIAGLPEARAWAGYMLISK